MFRDVRSLTKQVDVDFLQVVDAAELVQLVVDLVVDERPVVVGRVVLHDVVHCDDTTRHDGDDDARVASQTPRTATSRVLGNSSIFTINHRFGGTIR